MNNNKWLYIAYGLAWISTAIAVSIGLYYTKSANCLWAMFIPACVSVKSNKDDEE